MAEEREMVCGYAHNVGGAVCITPAISGGSDQLTLSKPACAARLPVPTSAIGPSLIRIWSPTIRKWTGKSACPDCRGPGTRLALANIPVRPCRSRAQMSCSSGLRRRWASTPIRPLWRFCPSLTMVGRCIHCGFCNGYGCEVNAKSSSLVTVIPVALARGTASYEPTAPYTG